MVAREGGPAAGEGVHDAICNKPGQASKQRAAFAGGLGWAGHSWLGWACAGNPHKGPAAAAAAAAAVGLGAQHKLTSAIRSAKQLVVVSSQRWAKRWAGSPPSLIV